MKNAQPQITTRFGNSKMGQQKNGIKTYIPIKERVGPTLPLCGNINDAHTCMKFRTDFIS